jgi:hypothetical protein
MTLERLNKFISDKNVKENVLKYSLLYHGAEWEVYNGSNTNEFTGTLLKSFNSTFLKLILEILQGEKVCFKTAYEKYVNEIEKSIPTNSTFALATDIDIIVQTAYFHNYVPAIETILKRANVDSDKISIHYEKDKSSVILYKDVSTTEQ